MDTERLIIKIGRLIIIEVLIIYIILIIKNN